MHSSWTAPITGHWESYAASTLGVIQAACSLYYDCMQAAYGRMEPAYDCKQAAYDRNLIEGSMNAGMPAFMLHSIVTRLHTIVLRLYVACVRS